jgi:CRISPR-associated protein (TIGR03986 family)
MSQPVDLPKHKNPDREHAAHAPYNFIPLPDMIVEAVKKADELPDHDRYMNGRHTGTLTVTLKTLTPLYIRGMLTEKEFKWQEEKKYLDGQPLPDDSRKVDFRRLPKNKPGFFAVQENPVIPGSSLRGMLRNLIEVITYSKVQWVTDKPIVYRAVGDPTSVGDSYREKVLGKNKTTPPDMHFDYPIPELKGGYLRRTETGWAICPATQYKGESFVHVEYEDANPIIGGHGRHRVHDVYVEPASRQSSPRGQRGPGYLTLNVAVAKRVSDRPGASLIPAKLVKSGHMGGGHPKHWHCAIYEPDDNASLINIPDELWQIYQEDRDMTKGIKPRKLTSDGDPLFYLLDRKGRLVFFGPTMMFRLPYTERALDLIPPELRDPNKIDFAEAMFGFVRTKDELKQMKPKPQQGSKGRAYAGRVFVTDGRYQQEQGDPWLKVDSFDGVLEPPILASPKPTSFQLYLTQDTPNNRKTLYHYDSNADAGERKSTLRGFKMYWPQGKKSANDLTVKPQDDRDQQRNFETHEGKLRVKWNSTQHTRMKPVDSDRRFTFHIHFENLTNEELGALQWALSVPECHRLGMGKPLGMGVVQLEKVELQLTGRPDRYKALFAGEGWNFGTPEKEKREFITDFETFMKKRLPGKPSDFRQVERIRMLLKMLSWQETDPQKQQKQYMGLNDFRRHPQRKVLPDPLNLGGTGGSSGGGSQRRGGGGQGRQSRRSSSSSSRNPYQSSAKSGSSTKKSPRQSGKRSNRKRRNLDDSIPDVRENVDEFADMFIKKLREEDDET